MYVCSLNLYRGFPVLAGSIMITKHTLFSSRAACSYAAILTAREQIPSEKWRFLNKRRHCSSLLAHIFHLETVKHTHATFKTTTYKTPQTGMPDNTHTHTHWC